MRSVASPSISSESSPPGVISVGDVGGRGGLALATVIGDGGAAAADLATVGTLLGNGVSFVWVDLIAELGTGGAELGTAGPEPEAELDELGFGVGVTLCVEDDEGDELGPGGSPPGPGG